METKGQVCNAAEARSSLRVWTIFQSLQKLVKQARPTGESFAIASVHYSLHVHSSRGN